MWEETKATFASNLQKAEIQGYFPFDIDAQCDDLYLEQNFLMRLSHGASLLQPMSLLVCGDHQI